MEYQSITVFFMLWVSLPIGSDLFSARLISKNTPKCLRTGSEEVVAYFLK